jgi:hypothetical protein
MSHAIRRSVVAGLALLLVVIDVAAVSRSTDGTGQVLIFPYYNASGGNASLLSIRAESTQRVSAVQVSVPQRDGDTIDFIVYLSSGVTWTAAIITDGADRARLLSSAPACTFPALREAGATDYSIGGLPASGMITAIELGAVQGAPLYLAATPRPDRDCSQLSQAWANGIWSVDPLAGIGSPKNVLSGSLHIVETARGVGYSVDTVVLDDFSTAALHRDVRSAPVTLAHTDPVSRVLIDGQWIESTWPRGIDALSAVLLAMHTEVDVWAIPDVSAATDVMLTLPTFALHEAAGNSPFEYQGNALRLEFAVRDRSSGRTSSHEELHCSPPVTLDQRDAIDRPFLSYSTRLEDSVDADAAPLNAVEHASCFGWISVPLLPPFTTGTVGLRASPPASFSTPPFLTSLEAHRHYGVPMIVTALARSTGAPDGKSFGFQMPAKSVRRVETVPQ